MKQKIDADIYIEDLIEIEPESIEILLRYGVACIKCGSPIWGTLGDNCKRKGLNQSQVDEILAELIKFAK